MKPLTPNVRAPALLAAALLPALFPWPGTVRAQGFQAPARINFQSIRPTQSSPLMAALGRGPEYAGGFFHLQRNTAPVNYQEEAEMDGSMLAPRPAQQPEEIIGELEAGPQPMFADEVPLPGEGPIPADGHHCGGKCGDGHGWGWWHDLNWACLCVPLPPDDNFSINFGMQGFTGPLNGGFDGSFGIHQGFNLGAALPCCTLGIGWQIGLQAVQSNFSGTGPNFPDGGFFDEIEGYPDDRKQLFLTAGLFRRVDCGWQWGIVYDHLHDDFYYDLDFKQIRGEISYLHHGYHELGFMFNVSTGEDTSEEITYFATDFAIVGEATDLYAIFYRHQFDDCGLTNFRVFVGMTDERGTLEEAVAGAQSNLSYYFADHADTVGSSAVFGADVHLGLGRHWALETGFTYLTAANENHAAEESWNVGFNFVWYPHGHSGGTCRGYYRPLFDVADNGSLLTHVKGITSVASGND